MLLRIARQWVQRLVIRGRPRMLGLGGYPVVSLAEARNVAFANRQRARAGGDPLAEKRHGQGVPTVEEAAAAPRLAQCQVRAGLAAQSARLCVPAHRGAARVRGDHGRRLGHSHPDLAREVPDHTAGAPANQCRDEMGDRHGLPAGQPGGRRPRAGARAAADRRPAHAGAAHGAVADALATVRSSPAAVTTKRAFEFLVLTAARSGEVRLATWDEMDLDAGVWAIPAARMKAKRDHRVPLSGRALASLHDVQKRSDGTGLVFRSLRGKPLSAVTLPRLTKELGIAAVPHGFRSSFRDWAAEQTNTPREVVEAALAHTVQNPTEAAYARSDLFERRRRLMDDWASAIE